MADYLPPSVSKLVADITGYVGPMQTATTETNKFSDAQAKASLASQRAGLAAEQSAARAVAAQAKAAAAAQAAAKGTLSQADAEKAAQDAAFANQRAQLAQASATLKAADAAKADSDALVRQRAAAENAGSGIASGLAKGAAAVIAVGVATTIMSAKFDASMELLHTQAGAPQTEVDNLKNKVLDLAGVVGFSPNSLATALYHVESVGYRGNAAIAVLTAGAKEAAIAHSNLDDTIYSLTSTMKTYGDTGVAGATKDTAALNAIVGQGDMRFQDLNDAIKTGLLSTMQTFGVSIESTGAALAYLTDRGEQANTAATRLSMGITLMEVPTKKAQGILTDLGVSQQDIKTGSDAMTEALKASGLTQTQLASDLRKPDGIYVALNDLKTKMTEDGIAASQQGAIIADVFGGARTGKAVMALYESLGQVQGKFVAINTAEANWGQSWQATQQTMTQRWHEFVSMLEADGVKIGHDLTPAASEALKVLVDIGQAAGSTVHFLAANRDAVIALGLAYAALKIDTILAGLKSYALVGGILLEGLKSKALAAVEGLRALGGGSLVLGGLMAGAVAGGIYVGVSAIDGFVSGTHAAETAVSQMNSALAKTPLSTVAYGSAIDAVRAKIASLHSQMSGFGGFAGWFTGSSENAAAQIDRYRAELAKLTAAQDQAATRNKIFAEQMSPGKGITGGLVPDPTAFAKNLALINEMTAAGFKFNGTFEQSQAQVEAFAKAAGNSVPAQEAVANVMKDQQKAATDAATAATDLQKAIDALGVANQNLYGTELDVNKAILTLSQNIATGSRTLDANSLAGIQNNQAILSVTSAIQSHVKAMTDQQDSQAQVTDYVYASSVSLEKQLTNLGFNKQAVDFLIQSLLKLPPKKATDVSTPGATQSKSDIDKLKTSLDGLHNKQLIVSVIDNASKILGDIHTAAAGLINLGFTPQGAANTIKATHLATGGRITGPGTGTSDTAGIFALSNGEAVVPERLVPAVAPILAAGGVPGFAQGGLVDTSRLMYDVTSTVQSMGSMLSGASGGGSGPASASQSVAAWAPTILRALAIAGAPASWLSGEETIMSKESGGSTTVVNPIADAAGHAIGLMQMKLGTFLAHALPGMTNIYSGLDQLVSSIRYQESEYGSPYNIPGVVRGSYGGYAAGGDPRAGETAWVGERGRELVRFGRDAHVFNAAQSRAMTGGTVVHNHFYIDAVDAESFAQMANRPGVMTKFLDVADRHVQRTPASARPSWTN